MKLKEKLRFTKVRYKLTAFMVLLSAVLLALVWLLSVQMLKPVYNRRVRDELSRVTDVYADILKKYDLTAAQDENELDEMTAALLTELLEHWDLLAGKCIDIGKPNGESLLTTHTSMQSGACLLHPEKPSQTVWGKTEVAANTVAAVQLRALIFSCGDMDFTLPDERFLPTLKAGRGGRQMCVCRNIGGRYSLMISTDLERVGQAADVIRDQMPIIAAVLLLVSVAGAFVFSRWFTKPILEVSDAARRVAKGDYTARVSPGTHDELGALAADFQPLAAEVGRTAELQRDLLANVSHDLRTPLTLIKGYAETVRDLTGTDAEKRTEQLSIIIDEADRLSALVGSVMELSRYSSGAQKPELVSFDMAQLCDEVACRYDDICQKNGYTLTLDAPGPCPVTADPGGMTRVVHNLLANAVHHIGEDGVIVLHVHKQADDTVMVHVEDHGAGIAKEDLPYIFDKYYRARADAGKQGTGLGLSITKAILIAHGFPFGVDSGVGKGTVFWFTAKP